MLKLFSSHRQSYGVGNNVDNYGDDVAVDDDEENNYEWIYNVNMNTLYMMQMAMMMLNDDDDGAVIITMK